MYWALYPFQLSVIGDRTYVGYWKAQNEIIKKEITFPDPVFSIEPIVKKHIDLGMKWVDSSLKILDAHYPMVSGYVINDHGDSNLAAEVIAGLRLLKNNNIIYLYKFGLHEISYPRFNVHPTPKYILALDEISELIQIIRKFKALPRYDRIRTAVNFYNFSYNTSYAAVEQLRKLGNLMTCAESIFVPKNSRTKKTPIKRGVANLIGINNTDKKKLRDEFHAAYDIRNAFVHGDNVYQEIIKYNKHNFGKFVLDINEYLRICLRKKLDATLDVKKARNLS